MINSTLIELKKLLNSMENDFGLNSLSEVERNVLYAIKDLEKENGAAKTGHLLDHEFTANMSRVSVFRGIKALEVGSFDEATHSYAKTFGEQTGSVNIGTDFVLNKNLMLNLSAEYGLAEGGDKHSYGGGFSWLF